MKENQRIRVSRQCLRESLIRLMQAKSIHKISVREICDGAEINRTTFYKYYGSQYDLLKDMENAALTQVDDYLKEIGPLEEDAMERLERLLAHIQDNVGVFRLLINNTVDTDFPQRLISLPMIKRILRERIADGVGDAAFEYVYDFIINGDFSMVKSWINKENRESPQEITRILMRVAPQLFS